MLSSHLSFPVASLLVSALNRYLKPVFHSHVFHSPISPAKNLISCSFVPSAKGQTEDENFQRLDQQNKFLQRRMNVKNDFYVKIFRRRRRNDGVENGLYSQKPNTADVRFSRSERERLSMFSVYILLVLILNHTK